MTNYSEYTAFLSGDADTYGEITPEQFASITRTLTGMIESEFPGITVNTEKPGASASAKGPDDDTCQEIDMWIADNWEAAL